MRPSAIIVRTAKAPTSRTKPASFTLIELLVVVGIISLLISILTPSLSRARQQAKATVCLTRLSEFMKGLTAYAGDNYFLLPPIMYDVPTPPLQPPIRHGWAEALYRYLYHDQDYALDQDFPVQRNLDGRFELWVCKEAIPMTNNTGHYRVHEVAWRTGSLDHIKARMPVILDANPQVTDPNDLRLSYVPREHIAGLQGEAYIDQRHYGAANYAFNDGHAERSAKLKEQLALDWDLDPNTPNE
jgi:prepilin-type processing-associated H-X9-DG protein